MNKIILPASAKWREIINQHAVSGLSVKQFCRRSGVAESSFFAWKRRLRPGAARPTFIEAKLAGTAVADVKAVADSSSVRAEGVIDVRLRGGRIVRVRPGFDRRLLVELIGVLESRA